MQAYYRHLQTALVKHFHVDEDVPFSDLPEQFKQALYFGTNGRPIEMNFSDSGKQQVAKPFEGTPPANPNGRTLPAELTGCIGLR